MDDRNLRGKIRYGRVLACALAACALSLAVPLAAQAASANYVALGDSYTSSPFTGGVATGVPTSCFQSTNNYPHLVAAAIQAASLTDVSCSGAMLSNMTESQTNVPGLGTNPPQLDAVTPLTTLVTVSISANDANVIGIAQNCLGIDLLLATGSACEDKYLNDGVDQVSQTISAIAPGLAATYQAIHARAPGARVLAVGYPALMPVNGTSCWPLLSISPSDVAWLNSLLVQLNTMIATTAAANNVEYVDTYTPTIGHDVCQPSGASAFTSLLPTSGLGAPLHPNAYGQKLMADAVLAAIGNPRATVAQAGADLRLTKTSISHSTVTASGTINPAYDGSVTITFRARYHGRKISLRGVTTASGGRLHATLPIPSRYRGVLHTGVFTATSQAHSGLGPDTARAHVR